MRTTRVSLRDILRDEYGICTEAELDEAMRKLGAIDISVFHTPQQKERKNL